MTHYTMQCLTAPNSLSQENGLQGKRKHVMTLFENDSFTSTQICAQDELSRKRPSRGKGGPVLHAEFSKYQTQPGPASQISSMIRFRIIRGPTICPFFRIGTLLGGYV